MIKKKCNNAKFQVIICCQGQSMYYQYKTLGGALFGYANQYIRKKKYRTMNFSLKEIQTPTVLEADKAESEEV